MWSINIFAIPPFLAALLIISIGLYVWLNNPRSEIHQGLSYFCLSLALWLGCFTLMYCATHPSTSLWWARIGFAGIAFIAVANFYFNLKLLKITGKKVFLGFLFLVSIVLAGLGQTQWIYRGIEKFFWGYYPQAGDLYGVFMAYYVLTWLYGLRLLYQKMREKKNEGDFLSYNQIKYVFIAWLGGSLGIVDFLPKYGIPIYPFAYLVALYWVLISAAAITRYRLLADISFLTRRVLIVSGFFTVAAIVFMLILGISYSAQRYFPSANPIAILTVFCIILGVLFERTYQGIRNSVDRIFFPEYYERKEKLARLGQEILLSKNSSEFNRILLSTLFSYFKIVRAAFFIWDESKKVFLVQAASGWGLHLDDETTPQLSLDHPIPKYLQGNKYLLFDRVTRDFSSDIDQRSLTLSMLKLEAAICVPIRSNQRLLGFFALGDKESGLPYGTEDIQALQVLADHTAIAMENIDLSRRWNEGLMHTNQLNNLLHRYLSSSVADEILERVNTSQNWKGNRRYVTVLMSDLRGFTKISETYAPEEVMEWLNEYLSEMVELVISSGGIVDKFMGDGILAIFGAPTPLPQSENHAVECALKMKNCMNTLNEKRAKLKLLPLEMGIGISAGNVIAGNVGSAKRMEYTMIGDPVNVASRLQSIAGNGQIFVSADVAHKVTLEVNFRKLGPMQLKGKARSLTVFEILGFSRKTPKDKLVS